MPPSTSTKDRVASTKILGKFFEDEEAEDGEVSESKPRTVSSSSSQRRKPGIYIPSPHPEDKIRMQPPDRGLDRARGPPRSSPRESPTYAERPLPSSIVLPTHVYSTSGEPSSRPWVPPPPKHGLPPKPPATVTTLSSTSRSPEKPPRIPSNGTSRRPSTGTAESGRSYGPLPASSPNKDWTGRPRSPLPLRPELLSTASGPRPLPPREWNLGKRDNGHDRRPRDEWREDRRGEPQRAPRRPDDYHRRDRAYDRSSRDDYDHDYGYSSSRDYERERRPPRLRSPPYRDYTPPHNGNHYGFPAHRGSSRSRSPSPRYAPRYDMVPSSNYDAPLQNGIEEARYPKDEGTEKNESVTKSKPITLKRDKAHRSDAARHASPTLHSAESFRPPTPDAPPPPPPDSPPPATPPAPPTVPHAPLLHQDKTRPPSPEREEGEYVEPPPDEVHREQGKDRKRDNEPDRFRMRTVKEEEEAYGRVFVGSSTMMGYETGRKLGEGTFGVVTQATERSTGREVALKKITTHNQRDGAHITTLREIKILKSLNHPNVVPLIDMVMSRGKSQNQKVPTDMFMVFPYMDHDLCGLLGNPDFQKRPSVHKSLMKQLLEGMGFIHANNIIHRDIKTANILVDKHYQVMIADFGLARPWTKEADMPPHLAREYTNMVVTRWYRAPELLLGATRYTPAVDLWSVGCVLGELYMKRPLLPGGGDREQLAMIVAKCGPLNQETWPGWRSLPGFVDAPGHDWERTPRERHIAEDVQAYGLDRAGMNLLAKLLTLDPSQRPTASEALDHPWFWIDPLPINPKTEPPLKLESSHEMSAWHHKQPAVPVQPPPQPAVPPRVSFPQAPQGNPYGNNPYAPPPSAQVRQPPSNYPHARQPQHIQPPAPDPYQSQAGYVPYQQLPGQQAFGQVQPPMPFIPPPPNVGYGAGYGAGPPADPNASAAGYAAMAHAHGGAYGGPTVGYNGATQGGYIQPSQPAQRSYQPAPQPPGLSASTLPPRPKGPKPPSGFSLKGSIGGGPPRLPQRNRPPQNPNFGGGNSYGGGGGGGGGVRDDSSWNGHGRPGGPQNPQHLKREHSTEEYNANKRHKSSMMGGRGDPLPYD